MKKLTLKRTFNIYLFPEGILSGPCRSVITIR